MDELPSLSVARELPLDDLALRLLRYLRAEEQGGRTINRHNLIGTAVLNPLAEGHLNEYLRLIQEAWDWLYSHGLISRGNPAQSSDADWAFVTRKGLAVIEEPDGLARLKAERRLDVDLHLRIAGRVRRQFLLGEYELAAIAALKEVEIRVRELAGASESDIGVKLMTDTFKTGGPLHDASLDKGESEAVMALFRGAIGVFKNPSSHRQVEFDDPTAASEVVLLADLLLRLLDQTEKRLGGH
jgi:uncharacterized protein (TIGR02391 family)